MIEDESLDPQEDPNHNLTWTCDSLEGRRMVAHINFQKPSDISSNGYTDSLFVHILDF